MTEAPIVFGLPGYETLSASLSRVLGATNGDLAIREFPDGETYVRGETRCEDRDVVLAANLFQPNPTVLPLLFCVQAVRELGARRVVLATPYLPYMRQDARFQPGEVVTSRVFASLLSANLDGLATIDPHLHRYTSLGDVYSIPATVGHAAPAVARWINENVESPLLIGPDSESEQWVGEVASLASIPFVVLAKKRHGDRDVEIVVPPLEPWREHTPVLVDDIISTARTMIETVGHLLQAGYSAPVCIGVHAIFAEDAYESLKKSGASTIVTCNTVSHSSNAIDISATLAESVSVLLSTGDYLQSRTRIRS